MTKVAAALLLTVSAVFGQGQQSHAPAPAAGEKVDLAAAERGKAAFRSNCGFCHGEDARGSRGPDLMRSELLLHDEAGSVLKPFLHVGRPEKGMPAFANLPDADASDILAFLHHQAVLARHSRNLGGDYALKKLLTGNAPAGERFFSGEGGCAGCHSVTGDLAGVANRYPPIDLQQQMVYPYLNLKKAEKTADVETADGKRFSGRVVLENEYDIALIGADGWYRSWPLGSVRVDVHDPLQAHEKLMRRYSDADIHNLLAYLETLK